MSRAVHEWWANLRHGGMLLDMQRLSELVPELPARLSDYLQDKLRRELVAFQEAPEAHRSEFVRFVLYKVCGFSMDQGEWSAGGNVDKAWTRRAITGEALRPNHLWVDHQTGSVLPIFIDDEKRLGIGKGRRSYSRVLQWLRHGDEQLAILTNGSQWRLVFAGLDYDAFCEWDIDQWFYEGQPSLELAGLVALVSPKTWVAPEKGKACRLLTAINDSRKGQSDLSQVLGERVRQAAEHLIQAHAPVLNEHYQHIDPRDIYRASVRMIMRLVVVLFAESREGLLPRDNAVYHGSYSVQELRDNLSRASRYRLVSGYAAWPRLLALMRLIYLGSSHEALPVPAYGGELFAPGKPDSADGVLRVIHLFETVSFGQRPVVTDFKVHEILDLLTRTKIMIRQGKTAVPVPVPVDFASLDSEYIGILYEGLLDFELRCVGKDEPVVFLAVGNQPALPLSTLEAMDDKAIKNLLEKMKDTSSGGDDEEAPAEEAADEVEPEATEVESGEEEPEEEGEVAPAAEEAVDQDERYTLRQRAEAWARHACEAGGLVRKPKGNKPDQLFKYERTLSRLVRQLIPEWAVKLPGEWYLVRWGGTRKGAGTFYTRPQLATPTAHRTLRPLAYNPVAPAAVPADATTAGTVARPTEEQWTPKLPEEILALKVCDPACGSGSFLLAALRFLTGALYESLLFHGRIKDYADQSLLQLIEDAAKPADEGAEMVPCRPDDDTFEDRTKAKLRRYVVERCIYGVDLDPLAVELCRLSLWIETLDYSMPMTFLNHKVKCGNSLVGAWFDQFAHYPLMAWEREGGDKGHTNGVHFQKEQFTKAIAELKKKAKAQMIHLLDDRLNLSGVDLKQAQASHAAAMQALAEIHGMGITQIAERQARYEALLADPGFVRLKEAFDLWCALWFWPLDRLDLAPLPEDFAKGEISDAAREIVHALVPKERMRFFHWELEFPDVFNAGSAGFDALLGNPPWDISKPNSKEFYSSHDPLYRSYGKQEAIAEQRKMFERDRAIEEEWLDYSAYFKAMSNWVKAAGFPFGDRLTNFDVNLGTSAQNAERHKRWRQQRAASKGFADAEHSFRHQGGGDINLYKLFLEQAHAMLRFSGRLGFIVPAGICADDGAMELRKLFLDRCRWHWLFGYSNRDLIFDIDPRVKFCPLIVEKGNSTLVMRTAFMRRQLSDWEHGEDFATDYPREQVEQFSPHSLAILEIQSVRDLEILTKIYSNSVLLGDQGPDGWGIQYAREFDMTNDSKLFPPRTKWEEWGYLPDEYSRWIKGPWHPINELLAELGAPQVNAAMVAAGERFRVAQPPYDRLSIPRADIPPGIILSRHADMFIREQDIPLVIFTEANGKPLRLKSGQSTDAKDAEVQGKAIALALYQGPLVYGLANNAASFLGGGNSAATWRRNSDPSRPVEPQYLMGASVTGQSSSPFGSKLVYRTLSGPLSNERSAIPSVLENLPCGNSLGCIRFSNASLRLIVAIAAEIDSMVFDWVLRARLAGMNINVFYLQESGVARLSECSTDFLAALGSAICLAGTRHSCLRLLLGKAIAQQFKWATTEVERARILIIRDALVALLVQFNMQDIHLLLAECSYPPEIVGRRGFIREAQNPKGFWRIDREALPELRRTTLTLVAFHDLLAHVERQGGDREAGIASFMAQNDGEGWMLPETLRLADYGLGHDDRAQVHQPVRECFGPRFYDWQLAQSAEESWRECHLHARNLLGAEGYAKLLEEIEHGSAPVPGGDSAGRQDSGQRRPPSKTSGMPLFDEKEDG